MTALGVLPHCFEYEAKSKLLLNSSSDQQVHDKVAERRLITGKPHHLSYIDSHSMSRSAFPTIAAARGVGDMIPSLHAVTLKSSLGLSATGQCPC